MNTTQKHLTSFLTGWLLVGVTSCGSSTDSVINRVQKSTIPGNEASSTTKMSIIPFPEKFAAGSQQLNVTSQHISTANIYAQNRPSGQNKTFVGYYESWCAENRKDWCDKWQTTNPKELFLAHVAPYVNMVIVSFMRPNATYSRGSYQLENTGLEFSSDGKVVRDAIKLLKQKNPGTKVLVSVGGFNYTNKLKPNREPDPYVKPEDQPFNSLNVQALADLVQDLGFDGVDINFEPNPGTYAQCTAKNNKVSCNTDELYYRIVKKVREKLPGKVLAVSAWSTGAYGEGRWTNSKPVAATVNGSRGLLLNLLRSDAARYIDKLIVMSYSGGTEYDPKEALAAYQNYFQGNKIVMGVHVPAEPWPPAEAEKYVYTIPKVRELTQAVINRNADGIMLWSLHKPPTKQQDGKDVVVPPSQAYPNAEMISKEVCKILKLGGCDKPLFLNQQNRTNSRGARTSQKTLTATPLAGTRRQGNVQSPSSNSSRQPQEITDDTDDQAPVSALW